VAKKKDNRLTFLIALAVFALVLANVYIFTKGQSSTYCYLDLCVIGKSAPLEEIRSLINSSSKVIIVVEADDSDTQKNEYLMGVFVMFGKDFGNKKQQIIGIAVKDSQPIRCVCTSNFNSANFTACLNSTDYCENIQPNEGEMLLKVYYPNFAKNEIIVDNRTIIFQAKSGVDAFASVQFFGDFFIRNVIK